MWGRGVGAGCSLMSIEARGNITKTRGEGAGKHPGLDRGVESCWGQYAVHWACLFCTVSWASSLWPHKMARIRLPAPRRPGQVAEAAAPLYSPSSHVVFRPLILVSPAGLTDQKMQQKLQTSSGWWLHHGLLVPSAVQGAGGGEQIEAAGAGPSGWRSTGLPAPSSTACPLRPSFLPPLL